MMRLVVVVACVAIATRTSYAQPADVPALIKLIDNQPADMDRPAWKEKRRDAARKLVQSKDKRSVPILEKLAENETFDIIGEIAIEGLGTVGDAAAVPTLQKIAGDPSRDKGQRDLAKKSLAKLGAGEAAPVKPPPLKPEVVEPTGGDAAGSAAATGTETTAGATLGGEPTGGSKLLGTSPSTPEVASAPELSDDTLAAYERLTFAGGTANLGYDTVRKRVDFDADVAGNFQKRVEREAMAWGWDAGAHVVAGWISQSGGRKTHGAQLDANVDGELRFYSGSWYGVGKGATALQLNYTVDLDPNNPANDVHDTHGAADLEVALGGGYGRVLDVGAAIRVRRLARALDGNRALGRPIDAATAKKLQLTWWALRGERSTYRSLVATIAVLRQAGILLGEPDSGVTYEILNVLRDTQLFLRPSGFDAQLAFGEGYLRRPAGQTNVDSGRIEQLLALAGYGQQLDDDKLEISGTAYARYRLFAATGAPSPWGAGATGRVRRFTYGDHGDPFGVVDLTGNVLVSTDDIMMSDKSLRISAELGFTYVINQASGLRLAAQLAENNGQLFFGAQLQATYGLLDGTFAR